LNNKRLADALSVTEDAVEDVYKAMFKVSQQDRQRNCGSCRFEICEQMVAAIILGTRNKEDCSHYMEVQSKVDFLKERKARLYALLDYVADISKNLEVVVRDACKEAEELNRLQSIIETAYCDVDGKEDAMLGFASVEEDIERLRKLTQMFKLGE